MGDAIPDLETTLQLRRESAAEQVAGALRGLIVSARLPADTHLREGTLASQLGVSRNTIREAIQILVSQGLVTREIHRGAYVARLSVDDVRDLFRVRRLVELTAVGEVAGTKHTSSLHDAIQAQSAAIDSGEQSSIVEADLHFHKELVDLMRSERLGDLYASVDAGMRLCIALAAPASPEPSRLAEDHLAIVKALEEGNAALASMRLKQHLDESERLLIAAFEAELVASAEAGGVT